MTASHSSTMLSNDEQIGMSRRSILKFMSAGAVGFGLGVFSLPVSGDTSKKMFSPNVYLEIFPNNDVHFWCKRTEMGQLVHVSQAMMVADELGANLDTLKLHQTTGDEKYGWVGTGGSGSTLNGWKQYRKMMAAAREMLIGAAAKQWNVDATECEAVNSYVRHIKTNKKASFGALALLANEQAVPENPVFKKASDYRYIGKDYGRRDTDEIMSGKAVYSADVTVPGMKYVSMERCPVRGGKLISVNCDEALGQPGVLDVIQIGDAVAVIAENSWSAITARGKLQINWDFGENQYVDSNVMSTVLTEGLDEEGYLIREEGEATEQGTKTIEKSYIYSVPAAPHAPLEPVSAVAWYNDGVLQVWSPCHMQVYAMGEVAEFTGLKKEKIILRTPLVGGSFGRKLTRDYIFEVASVAMKVPYPIQLLYTREDEMAHGTNRPPTMHRVSFKVDENGSPVACDFHMSGYSIAAQEGGEGVTDEGFDFTAALGANDMPYSFKRIRISHKVHETSTLYFTWWRGTYRNHNCFALECAVDELALETNRDPLELRLELLEKDITAETFPGDKETISMRRMKGMLKVLAEKSRYHEPRESGRAVGIACHCYTDVYSYSAFAVEVSVSDGVVIVHKVTVAIDCGTVVNPTAVRAQVEGSTIFGLSGAMMQETTLENGRVQQLNFDSSPVLRMDENPEINVHIIPSIEAPGGVGEPALTPLMPAFINAVSRAAGKRIRRLPLGEQLLEAGDAA